MKILVDLYDNILFIYYQYKPRDQQSKVVMEFLGLIYLLTDKVHYIKNGIYKGMKIYVMYVFHINRLYILKDIKKEMIR